MELPLQLHRWQRRRTDWLVAAVAGFAGGAVLMVLELLWSAVAMDEAGPWRTSRMVAALVMGTGVLQASGHSFDPVVVAVALMTHYLLGVLFGVVLGFVTTGLRYETNAGVMLGFGALFGAVLYLFDFYGMVQFFPWFVELRGWPTLIAHLVFGITAALLYWKLARGRASPQQRT